MFFILLLETVEGTVAGAGDDFELNVKDFGMLAVLFEFKLLFCTGLLFVVELLVVLAFFMFNCLAANSDSVINCCIDFKKILDYSIDF